MSVTYSDWYNCHSAFVTEDTDPEEVARHLLRRMKKMVPRPPKGEPYPYDTLIVVARIGFTNAKRSSKGKSLILASTDGPHFLQEGVQTEEGYVVKTRNEAWQLQAYITNRMLPREIKQNVRKLNFNTLLESDLTVEEEDPE